LSKEEDGMTETKMKTVAFAKKLRERKAELKDRLAKEKKDYEAAVKAWRVDLQAWVDRELSARISRLSAQRDRYSRRGDYSDLFTGAPEPPVMPSTADKVHKIDGMLRRLSITGQETVKVTDGDLSVFADDATDDD
jgi:hypothetical protein